MNVNDAAAAAAHHGSGAGPLGGDPAFWVGVAFVLVVALAYRKVSKALMQALDMRAAKIKDRIDEAQRLHDEAIELLARYQHKQTEALHEAEEIIAHAKQETERLSKQAAVELEALLKRREQQAMERIAQAEAQALREVQNLAVDVAVNAAQSVLAKNLTAKQAATMLDGAIRDLPGKLH